MHVRRLGLTTVSIAVALLLLALLAVLVASDEHAAPPARSLEGEGQARAGDPDAGEGLVSVRLETMRSARAAGTLGRTGPIESSPPPGWAGAILMHPTADDWEPAIATDPDAPWAYALLTRFGMPPCKGGNCPDPAIVLRASDDGGRTWKPDRYLCVCRRVQAQFDPLIEVVPATGHVYAAWMNDWNIVFSRSIDHGATWTPPVPIQGKVPWGDKPAMALGDDGRDVYISFNGRTGGDPYVAVSHDAGNTWSQVLATNAKRYYFAYAGAVGPDGHVSFSEVSESYTAPGGESEGPVWIHVITSTDRGLTWTDTVVDTVELGSPCTSEWCYADFYDGHTALASDADGDLVILYDGAIETGGPRQVWARSSADAGATWSARTGLSQPGVNAGFPAAVGVGDDGVRAWFMDQRTGRWNVWYRTSRDLGATWTTAVRISDATSGTAYKDDSGFLEVYGDYGEIAVTSKGRTVSVWGEGISYAGPGGVWFNRET